jgi:hypothetical protein
MNVELRPEHEWLMQMEGTWEFESECFMGPDQPPSRATGKQVNRSLGGAWLLCEGSTEMPEGGPMSSVITLGFDPQQNHFTGSFVASCMTYLWLYRGTLDSTGKKLSLDAKGPSFTDPTKLANYIDAWEVVHKDEHILTSQFQDEAGNWHTFMRSVYRRVS